MVVVMTWSYIEVDESPEHKTVFSRYNFAAKECILVNFQAELHCDSHRSPPILDKDCLLMSSKSWKKWKLSRSFRELDVLWMELEEFLRRVRLILRVYWTRFKMGRIQLAVFLTNWSNITSAKAASSVPTLDCRISYNGEPHCYTLSLCFIPDKKSQSAAQ